MGWKVWYKTISYEVLTFFTVFNPSLIPLQNIVVYIFSNAWPPLQDIVVTGLEKSGYKPAQDLALNIVKKWVKNGFIAYKDTIEETGNAIYFEKYDVEKVFSVLKLLFCTYKRLKKFIRGYWSNSNVDLPFDCSQENEEVEVSMKLKMDLDGLMVYFYSFYTNMVTWSAPRTVCMVHRHPWHATIT